ncbi:MAG: hypothetical protein HY074_00675, partial [Deltaproteobacteria bacterium]|nr:hypothetical protein [Deltaproteobacteria bacterium]
MNPTARPWRSLWLLPATLFLTAATPALADLQTRIVNINGTYSTSHDAQLTVQPGDNITLTADEVDYNYDGSLVGQNRNVEDFTCSSDSTSSDSCDPNYDCASTNFETHQYGVTYYVPTSIGQSIVLTVQNRADGTYDQITLVNGSYTPDYTPPSGSYSDPSQYPTNDAFDYNRSLAGHGRWVYINGERTFVPFAYQAGWQPYQHGNWYWTSYGWTWNSLDPWGWVTDHYGHWRHHSTYGWCWSTLPEDRWYPHTVTFYHTNEGMGWYPYHAGYAHGYEHGYEHGYDDGYWEGFRAGLNSQYSWGGTFVRSDSFMNANIYDVREQNAYGYYGSAYSSQAYGATFVVAGYSSPRVFVESRIGRPVLITPMNVTSRITVGGGRVQFVAPVTRFAVPLQYRQAAEQAHQRVVVGAPGARIPVGSVVHPGGAIVLPRAPVVVAPRVPTGSGGYHTMPPRTNVPVSQPRPTNPQPTRPSYPTQPSRPTQPTRPSYPT